MFENTVNDVQDAVVEHPENEKALNGAGEEVVHPQNTAVGTSEAGPGQHGAEGVAKPHQSAEENSRYAKMRRELEHYRNNYNKLDTVMKDILPGLKEYGFNGETAEDIALELKANQMGVSVDELRDSESQRAADIEKAVSEDPRVIAAQEITRNAQFEKDLAAVKAAYPDVSAGSVHELGEVFINCMRAGLSPEDAYAAQLNYNKRTTTPPPPKMGTVQQSYEPEKDILSNSELDSLNHNDLVKNPKLLEKAMRSLTKK